MRLLAALSLALVVGALVGPYVTTAHAQLGLMSPDRLRFRLIGDEPLASPDGRSAVAGWKAIVIRDMKSGQCHIAFLAGSAMSVTTASVCPE
jgi:hypothetical protein